MADVYTHFKEPDYSEQKTIYHCPDCDRYYYETGEEVSIYHVTLCDDKRCQDCIDYDINEQ